MLTRLNAGMMSAAASLGLVLLWDIDAGLTQLDKYLYSKEDYIKVYWLQYKLYISNECLYIAFVMFCMG